jgi:beta-glucosidase
MAWSLLDNLEWSLGYSKRSASLVNSDAGSGPSGLRPLYAEVIKTHGEVLVTL